MKGRLLLIVEIAVMLGLGALGYHYWVLTHPASAPAKSLAPMAAEPAIAQSVAPSPSPSPAAAAAHYEVAEPAPDTQGASPPLDESDMTMEQRLTALLGRSRYATLINRTDFVRRVAATVSNATERSFPPEVSPVRAPSEALRVNHSVENAVLSPDNYVRYLPYVEALSAVDIGKLMAIYSRYYRIFQAAYRDLGTEGYFNDVLVHAIENCLETPEVPEKDPPKLVPYGLRYKFADPKLESLGAAQKLLIRMGPLNASIVKGRLRELRNQLTHLGKR